MKNAVHEALRDWVTTIEWTHDTIGSFIGPHPYAWMVRELQHLSGRGDKDVAQVRDILRWSAR